jgi:hypothetical protein
MYEDRKVLVTRTFCRCDRCGLEMESSRLDEEWEERLSISFRGGYFSEFGDGSLVEGDFCQHCVKELLGQWLRVVPDNPFEPEHKPSHHAHHAYQHYQLNGDVMSYFRQTGIKPKE